LTAGLEFYRREIERRRHLFRRVLQWSFGPVLLAVAALLLPIVTGGIKKRGAFRNMLPFLTLLALWIGGFFILRIRQQRQLQREIEELNGIERENKR